MLPYQERVMKEANELNDKINKLRIFIGSDTFILLTKKERDLLHHQYNIMNTYSDILSDRIELFSEEK